MDYEGNSIIQKPDKPDTYLLPRDLVLPWTESTAPLVIPVLRRGNFSSTYRYMLTIHLVYLWSRGAPDWLFQVYDADTGTLVHQQTEGLDSYSNRVSTLNEQIIVPTRNLRFLVSREADNVEDITIVAGSFFKVDAFA